MVRLKSGNTHGVAQPETARNTLQASQVLSPVTSAAGASQDFLSMHGQLPCVGTRGCLSHLAESLAVQGSEMGLVPSSRFLISLRLTLCCSLPCVSAQRVGNSFRRVDTAPAFPLGPGNCVVLKFHMRTKLMCNCEGREESHRQ